MNSPNSYDIKDATMCCVDGCCNRSYNDVEGAPCEDHRCMVPIERNYGSSCYCVRVDGSFFCDEHCCRFEKDGKRCSSASDYGLYCDVHRCKMCSGPIVDGSLFCEVHKCPIIGCSLKRTECKLHKCNCVDCHNTKIAGSEWCEKHTCSYRNCFEKNFRDYGCCRRHTCEYVSKLERNCYGYPFPRCYCNDVKQFGSKFCSDHTCPGCGKLKERQMYACGPNCSDKKLASMFILQSEIPRDLSDEHYVLFVNEKLVACCRDSVFDKKTHAIDKKVNGYDVRVCDHLMICEGLFEKCDKLASVEYKRCCYHHDRWCLTDLPQ